jgi:hypothetical protein
VNVVRLAEDAFCVLNATPFEKLHSWLNWVSERDVLDPPEATSSWEMGVVEEEPDLPLAVSDDLDDDDDLDDEDDFDDEDLKEDEEER